MRNSKKNRQHNGQKKKVQKDKQRSTNHTHKAKDQHLQLTSYQLMFISVIPVGGYLSYITKVTPILFISLSVRSIISLLF